MIEKGQCPELGEIRAWLEERLANDHHSPIEAHVNDCEACSAKALHILENQLPNHFMQNGVASGTDGEKDQINGNASERLKQTLFDFRSGNESSATDGGTAHAATYDLLGTAGFGNRDAKLPRMLDHFQLIGILGQGGMGRVYMAEDTLLHREVAVKVMRPDKAHDFNYRAKFLNEARAVARLDDDFVVPIFHVGIAEDEPYFVMPRLRGETLHRRIQREKRLPLSVSLQVAREITSGLTAVHQAGLIHRDLKPANVFLREDTNRACLLDFGVASEFDTISDASKKTPLVGTPQFMSPEQTRRQALTYASDLFALGIVIYEMISGGSPFRRDSVEQTLQAITCEPVPPLAETVEGVSQEMSDLASDLMAKDPEQRPIDAETVTQRLEQIRRDTASNASDRSRSSAWYAPKRRLWIAAAVLVFGLVGTVFAPERFGGKSSTANILISDEPAIPDEPAISSFDHPPELSSAAKPVFSATPSQLVRAFASYEPLPTKVKPGEPISPMATVSQPVPIAGVRSWSVELRSHYGKVTQILRHPDGQQLATSSNDGGVRLWDNEGRLKNILMGHFGTVPKTHSFSPCGRYLATKNRRSAKFSDPVLRIWDVESGRCVIHVRLPFKVGCLAWSPDGRMIALDGELGTIDIVSLDDDRRRQLNVEPETQGKFAWSADSQYLVTKSSEGPAIFDVAARSQVATLLPDETTGGEYISHFVSFSHDGQLVAGYAGSSVYLWDFASRQFLGTIETDIPVIWNLSWHPHRSEFMVSGVSGESEPTNSLERYWAPTGKLIKRHDFDYLVSEASYVGNGNDIALGHLHDLRIFDTTKVGDGDDHHIETGLHHRGTTMPIDRGRRLVCGDRIFSIPSGELVETIDNSQGDLVIADFNGRWFAYESDHDQLVVMPRNGSLPIAKWTIAERSDFYRADRAGRWLLRREGSMVHVYPMTADNEERQLQHPVAVWCAEISPDGTQVITLAADKKVRLWSVSTGTIEREKRFPAVRREFESVQRLGSSLLDWSSDGSSIFLGLFQQVVRLPLDTWAPETIAKIEHHKALRGIVCADNQEDLVVTTDAWSTSLLTHDAQTTQQDEQTGQNFFWSSDGKYFFCGGIGHNCSQMGTRFFDGKTFRRTGVLFGKISDEQWVTVGADGHYRGSESIDSHLVYTVLLEDGSNQTYTPVEFQERFGWSNEADRASLVRPKAGDLISQ
ncbi:Serine/threonine protein kinase [Neorhodopirellula lusitana]|uniref:Serine/threonine protein kinase n=1 Tax=Neorhodopirellula lusitana TaxID=445327 RepID=A0ABY1QU07_9BACT|nr:protein kinase [Neorhodopirellula lusitana]SMP78862.1 Serine/threonine protein kinase [Neorhodopirellula lusitana]